MNKGNIILRILCMVLFFLLTCTNATTQEDQERIERWKEDLAKHTTPIKPINLEYSHSLPLEKDSEKVYFGSLENFTIDEKEYAYVSDSQMNMITVFNENGEFIRQFGQQGQGPGDFNNPKDICIDKSGQIIVRDANNGRLQFFSPEGVYRNSFRLFVSRTKMAEKNNKFYLCRRSIKDKHNIVLVLNNEGKELYSFCESITKYGDDFAANYVDISINDKKDIYIAWAFLPIVRKYSENGSLLAEYTIDSKTTIFRFEQNLKSFSDNATSSKPKTFYSIICDIQATNNGFYIMWFYPRIEIFEYDQSGKLKHIYHADQPYNLIAEGFYVLEKGEEKYFYIANNYPEVKIDIFKTR